MKPEYQQQSELLTSGTSYYNISNLENKFEDVKYDDHNITDKEFGVLDTYLALVNSLDPRNITPFHMTQITVNPKLNF